MRHRMRSDTLEMSALYKAVSWMAESKSKITQEIRHQPRAYIDITDDRVMPRREYVSGKFTVNSNLI